MGWEWWPSMNLERVLVTGATGFIGSHLCQALFAAGLEIIALVHRSEPKTGGMVAVDGTLNDLTRVGEALKECDAVLHLAAFIPPDLNDADYAEECFRTNAFLTLRLAECVLASRPVPFIYLSSGQAYAYSPHPVSETAPLYPAKKAPYYLGTKLLGEIYVEHLRSTRGLHAVSLRVGSVYGIGMPENSSVARFMRVACTGGTLHVPEGGQATADFVSVSDIVWLMLEAVRYGEPGVYNAASGAASSILDLARTVADVFRDRRPQIKIQPPSVAVPASFAAMDIAKARRQWGYRPCMLSEGLAQYRAAMEGRQ